MPAISSSSSDLAGCAAMIRTGSHSFDAASRLLPAKMRDAARALYAFCRASDDMVDDDANRSDLTTGVVSALGARLDRIYAGKPDDHLPDRAFAGIVQAHAIPRAVPQALLEGFAWDEAGRTYETIDDLTDYAARVASTVGIMMTLIMGSRDRHVLARAADLGLAMQLTNIARDVGEDARSGRLYLPLRWMAEEGLDAERFLARPAQSPELARVVARLLAVAEGYYDRALTGVVGLPLACRPAIRGAAYVYRAIGRDIAAHGHDSVTRRARTSASQKATLMAKAMITATPFQAPSVAAPAPATQFLVDATALDQAAGHRGIDASFGRFIELVAVTEARERGLSAPIGI